jgi:hypothetical protein
MSFLAFGIVIRLYIWPRVDAAAREDALAALAARHTFRFVGLSCQASCLRRCLPILHNRRRMAI